MKRSVTKSPLGTVTFIERVIKAIKSVPRGKVATYGLLALVAGNPRGSRQVAWALHSVTEKEKLPWHRVINRQGKISLPKSAGYEMQKELLIEEGVTFDPEDRIDLDRFLWKPAVHKR
jgi:methylated-DNA-protein-cysteine methyltransferase-like protein